MSSARVDEWKRAVRNGRAREAARREFFTETWPLLMVRLRLAGAPPSVIDSFNVMRQKARWSRRHDLLRTVNYYESQLTHPAERS